MSVQMERKMAWTDSIKIKHFLIDRYLHYLDEKPLLIAVLEYALFCAYIVAIIGITICYYNVHDIESRLMWYDLTLYIGGIRLYNTIIMILLSIFGITMVKYLHLTNDKSLFKWTDTLRVVKGDLSSSSILLFRYDMNSVPKISFIIQIWYIFTMATYLLVGKSSWRDQ